MKTLPLLLGLSLAANAALFVHMLSDRATPAKPGSADPSAPTPAGVPPLEAGRASKAAAPKAAGKPAGWDGLRTEELPELVSRLRAAGFPPHLVRAIVAAEVQEHFAARRRDLVAQHPPRGYWKFGRNSPFDADFMTAYRELGREQSRMLRELLGPEAVNYDDISLAFIQRRFGDLPADKLDDMNRIARDYSDLRSEIYSRANGMMLPEDREKLAFLEKEERQDMATLLSPEELLGYELRSSNTASAVRSQLGAFQPSEEEFRQIFHAMRNVEAALGTLRGGYIEPQQRKQVHAAMLEELQGKLPPERLAEVDQAFDPEYQMPNRLVARLGLPASAARDLIAVQRDITQRAGAIRSNGELPAADRTAQLSALEREATARLSTTLGVSGLEAYRTYGGGWLRSLRAPASPRAAPGR